MTTPQKPPLSQETTYEVSYFRMILVAGIGALLGVFFSSAIAQEKYLSVGIMGLVILAGSTSVFVQGLRRPTLKLDHIGLTWGRHRYSWQQIRTFHSVKTLYSRGIWVYLEGHEKPFEPSGNKLKDLWCKIFPEEKPFGIDVSFFKASNDEIEDAMDQYYFPARGLSLDDDET